MNCDCLGPENQQRFPRRKSATDPSRFNNDRLHNTMPPGTTNQLQFLIHGIAARRPKEISVDARRISAVVEVGPF